MARAAKTQADGYVSEFTAFMNGYLKEHPEVVADQHHGWDIYWDKIVDFDEQKKAEETSVPVDSYYYFGNPWKHGSSAHDKSAGKG